MPLQHLYQNKHILMLKFGIGLHFTLYLQFYTQGQTFLDI